MRNRVIDNLATLLILSSRVRPLTDISIITFLSVFLRSGSTWRDTCRNDTAHRKQISLYHMMPLIEQSNNHFLQSASCGVSHGRAKISRPMAVEVADPGIPLLSR